jgi:hypothetical protein
MSSKLRHGLLISIIVIALFFAVEYGYGTTIEYTYDEAGNLIEKRIRADDPGLPTGTITINSGAASTNSTSVALTLSCSDAQGCSQMRFSNDNVTYSTPETYATTKAWTLTTSDATKTVYVKFKDTPGNWSTAYSKSILLDTATPTTSALPAEGIYDASQWVTLGCSDGTGSGCDKVYYTTNGSTPTTSSPVYSSPINITATTTLKFFAKDLAGNSESVKTQTYTIGSSLLPGRIGVFTNGTWYLDMNGNGAWDGPVIDKTFPNFGLPGWIPVVGDWIGSANPGKSKIGVYSNGTWYLDMNGNGVWDAGDLTIPNFGVGLPNTIPVTGDWIGSSNPGKSKIGVYSNGTWYLDMNGNGVWDAGDLTIPNFGVGLPNTIPVTGDWIGSNNPGKSKIGVYSNGTWYLDMNGNGVWDAGDLTIPNFGVGLPNAKAITGDWPLSSNPGKSKIGVYSNGTWYLDMNGNGAWDGAVIEKMFPNFGMGLPSVFPVVGRW